MTQPIHLIGEYHALEAPEGAINFTIDMGYLIFKVPNYANWCTDAILSDYGKLSKYLETHKAENDYKTGGIPLPGNWKIICATKQCTSEQAKEITGEEAYPSIRLHSLITSKGLDPNKSLIIKKVS
jgi:hypothetical protein